MNDVSSLALLYKAQLELSDSGKQGLSSSCLPGTASFSPPP